MVAQCVAHNIGHPEPGVFVVAQCEAQESEARALELVVAQCVAHNLPKSQKQEHNIGTGCISGASMQQCVEHNFRVVGSLARSLSLGAIP